MKNYCFIVAVCILSVSCETETEPVTLNRHYDGSPSKISYVNKKNRSDTLKTVEFYRNGNKKIEGKLKNNLRHGKWIYWYENGNKWSEGNFKNGLSNGRFEVYNSDGTRMLSSGYSNGEPDGLWIFFENNKKKKEVLYRNNTVVSSREY